MRVLVGVVFAVAMTSFRVFGDPACLLEQPHKEGEAVKPETIGSCWTRLATIPPDEGGAQIVRPSAQDLSAKVETENELLLAKSTSANLQGIVSGSATRNFLPLLNVLVETATLSEDRKTMTVDFKLPFLSEKSRSAVKVQGVITEPVLYEPLKEELPEATREDRASALENTLDDFDDVKGVVAWSPVNAHWGRSLRSHRALLSSLQRQVVQVASGPDATGLEELLNALHDEVSPFVDADQRLEKVKFADLPEATRQRVMNAVATAANEEHALTLRILAEAKKSGFFKLADLVNNQPQLVVTTSYRSRNELVGPDEFDLQVTYEHGFANLNSLRRSCRTKQDDQIEISCLANYLDDPGTQKALESGDKLSFSLQYNWVDHYEISLPVDMVELQSDKTSKLIASLTYGRYLAFDSKTGKDLARVDLSAQYENYRNQPDHQNRLVAALTFTQRVTDNVFFPVSISYANKSEFLDDTAKRVTAHVGLTWKLDHREEANAAKGGS